MCLYSDIRKGSAYSLMLLPWSMLPFYPSGILIADSKITHPKTEAWQKGCKQIPEG